MWVKICGITNLEDALCAIEAGADALGFVFYPQSSRYIDTETARSISEQLPKSVQKIGLFVNASAHDINLTCQKATMDIAQLHFDVDKAFLLALDVPYLRVVRAQTNEDVKRFEGSLRLVDAFVECYGGEGRRLDLSWFEKSDNENIILAGGLSPANIEEVKAFGFYGVDVSSGVEKTKGIKDHDKIRAFLQKAKA